MLQCILVISTVNSIRWSEICTRMNNLVIFISQFSIEIVVIWRRWMWLRLLWGLRDLMLTGVSVVAVVDMILGLLLLLLLIRIRMVGWGCWHHMSIVVVLVASLWRWHIHLAFGAITLIPTSASSASGIGTLICVCHLWLHRTWWRWASLKSIKWMMGGICYGQTIGLKNFFVVAISHI